MIIANTDSKDDSQDADAQSLVRMSRGLRVTALVMLAFTTAIFMIPSAGCSDNGSGSSSSAPPPPSVIVATPLLQQVVEWDEYTGRLDPVESVDVRARVSGYLDSIHFEEGQLVQQGDLLFVIDPRPFEAELNAANARLAEARAMMASAEANVSMADARKQNALSAVELEESRLARARQAVETNAIAREQVDIRVNELRQAEAALTSAEADIASAQAGIANAEAAIAQANASVRTAELNLEYTQIRASISGRIGEHRVTRGNLIDGGNSLSTMLTNIVSIDPIHVTFDANEQAFLKYYRLANSGGRKSSRDFRNPVYMALGDEEGFPHVGHMVFVDNRIDSNTGTIRGRAIFRNRDPEMTPGLFAKVRLPGSASYQAVMVPDEAISSNQTNRIVMTLDENDAVVPVTVKLGPLKDGLRIIRSGITENDRVIISGLQRVRPGMNVTVEPGEIVARPIGNGLPNAYEPVPESDWIRREGITQPSSSSTSEQDTQGDRMVNP